MGAEEALARLKEGNGRYLSAMANDADVSPSARAVAARDGQRPFAVVVSCSDSRVPPEHVFLAGVGDLFVVRTAGHVVGPIELGSVVYAIRALGARLVVVMGHTGCGAVQAAFEGCSEGAVGAVAQTIARHIQGAPDLSRACELNVGAAVAALRRSPEYAALEDGGVMTVGAVCDVATGRVTFLA